MLSEAAKARLMRAVRRSVEDGTLEILQEAGPRTLIRIAGEKCTPDRANIAANVDEAERYLAGLLGMV